MAFSKNSALRWAVRGVGFAIFAYLLYRIGPEKLWRTVAAVRPAFFVAALPIFFIMIWVKTVKMRLLMQTPLDITKLYRMNAFAFSVGSITPGRLGEFSKILFLSRFGVKLVESFTVTLIDRLSDVLVMIAFALAGLYTFFGNTAGHVGLTVVLTLAAASAVLSVSERMLKFFCRGRWRELVETESAAIRAYIRSISFGTWGATVGLTLAYLGLYFLQMWILVRGLSLPLDYFHTCMAISSAAIPAILPISVGNIGPRDAVLAAIFLKMGWGASSGVALSTLILALFLTNGLFGLLFLPRKEPV